MAFSSGVATVALGLALTGGCSPYGGGAFTCTEDAQCAGAGADPRCEADGRCSIADPTCGSGRRYGELSGDRANQCVGDSGPDIDAPPPDDATDAPLDTPPAAPFCDPANPDLVACWQFEGDTQDASGEMNHGVPTNTSFAAGRVGMALVHAATSVVAVADSASLSPPVITIEAWVHPTALPTGTDRMGILDNNNSYGFFIYANRLECTMTAALSTMSAVVPVDTWTHVACTFDGTTARIYVNGVEARAAAITGQLGAGDSSGSVIAGNSPGGGAASALVGRIDELRVWKVARTPQQVCEAALRPTCP